VGSCDDALHVETLAEGRGEHAERDRHGFELAELGCLDADDRRVAARHARGRKRREEPRLPRDECATREIARDRTAAKTTTTATNPMRAREIAPRRRRRRRP
jgi:hypothetical protein